MLNRRTIILVAAVLVLVGALIWALVPSKSGPTAASSKTTEGIDLRTTVDGPSRITVADNGKAFSYPIGSRFTVTLDSTLYPQNALSCAPPSSGIVRVVESVKEVKLPFYVRTFETVKPGTCTMTNTRFIAAIVVNEKTQ